MSARTHLSRKDFGISWDAALDSGGVLVGDEVSIKLEIELGFRPVGRPGAFAVSFDSSTWPAGSQPISATVCDGWSNASYNLGPIAIQH